MYAQSGKAAGLAFVLLALAMTAGCGTSRTRPAAPAAAARPTSAPATTEATATAAASAADTGAPVRPVDVPERASQLYAQALAAMDAGNFDEAEQALEQLVGEFPSFPGPFVNLAIIYRKDGRDDAAEAALEKALAIAPEHPAANNELGVLLREKGEFAAAEAAYRKAIAGDPNYAIAHYNLGVLLDLYLKRESEALSEYEAYQALDDDSDAAVGVWIADLKRRLGQPEEAPQVAQEDGS